MSALFDSEEAMVVRLKTKLVARDALMEKIEQASSDRLSKAWLRISALASVRPGVMLSNLVRCMHMFMPTPLLMV